MLRRENAVDFGQFTSGSQEKSLFICWQHILRVTSRIFLRKKSKKYSKNLIRNWPNLHFDKLTKLPASPLALSYTYMLTPKGLEEKAGLTLRFLKRKLAEYEEIKKQIRELHHEVEEEVLDDPDSELIVALKSII